jgi:hypothetical protein
MEKLFMTSGGIPWKVSDEPDMKAWVGSYGGPWRSEDRR